MFSRSQRPKTLYPTEKDQDVRLGKNWSSQLCLTSHLSTDVSAATVRLPSPLSSTTDSRLVSPTLSDAERLMCVASPLECSGEDDRSSRSVIKEHHHCGTDRVGKQTTMVTSGSSTQKRDDNEANVDIKQNGRRSIINQSAGDRKSYIIYAEQIGKSFTFLDDFDDFEEMIDEKVPPPTTTDLKLTAENHAFQISSTDSSSISCVATDCLQASEATMDVNITNNGTISGLSSSSARSTSVENTNSEAVRSRGIRLPTTAEIEDYKRLSIGCIDAISTVISAFSFLEQDQNV